MMSVRIRPYRPEDREAVRRICADTGFLGRPIDPVFEDRELFADYLTGYYTRVEPASLLVCELDGVVKGYLMGCRRPLIKQAYQAFANVAVAAKAIYRCYARPYNESSRTFPPSMLRNPWRKLLVPPPFSFHFYFNILPSSPSLASSIKHSQARLNILR